MKSFPSYKNQSGAVPLLLVISVVGIISFILLSNTLDLRHKLFNALFPKPSSYAALNNIVEAEQGTLSGNVTVNSDSSASGGKYITFGVAAAPSPSTAPSPTPTASSSPPPGVSGLPAFPGAEGFGAVSWQNCNRSQAKVIEVTNLNDTGTGSFRAAVAATGPRIVVFKVSGIIQLASNLSVSNPCIYVAGQTAPGGGILVRGGAVNVKTSDVIVRHIRFRLGNMDADNDTLQFIGASRTIFDHVSASWSIDETFSVVDTRDSTIQWSIISEPLNNAGHSDGNHGFCQLIRGSNNITVHHNIYAHCVRRSPQGSHKGSYQPKVQVVNSVMYDYIEHGTRVLKGDNSYPGTGYYDIVKNRYVAGPTVNPYEIELLEQPDVKLYINGNIGPHRTSDTLDQWALVKNSTGIPRSTLESLTPFAPANVTTQDADTAYSLVLSQAGATLPKRDSVDARIINEIKTITGKVVDCVEGCTNSAGGWPVIESGVGYADADRDGMSDSFETQYGFNPNSASDGPADADGDGYTNVEEFINGSNPKG